MKAITVSSSLTIGRHTWAIKRHTTIRQRYGLFGYASHLLPTGYVTTIYVADDLSPELFRETLLHEVFHAIELEASINIKEEEVEQFGRAWYDILCQWAEGIGIEQFPITDEDLPRAELDSWHYPGKGTEVPGCDPEYTGPYKFIHNNELYYNYNPRSG